MHLVYGHGSSICRSQWSGNRRWISIGHISPQLSEMHATSCDEKARSGTTTSRSGPFQSDSQTSSFSERLHSAPIEISRYGVSVHVDLWSVDPRTRLDLPAMDCAHVACARHEDWARVLWLGVQQWKGEQHHCVVQLKMLRRCKSASQRSDILPTAGSGHTTWYTATVLQTSLGQLQHENRFHKAGGG